MDAYGYSRAPGFDPLSSAPEVVPQHQYASRSPGIILAAASKHRTSVPLALDGSTAVASQTAGTASAPNAHRLRSEVLYKYWGLCSSASKLHHGDLKGFMRRPWYYSHKGFACTASGCKFRIPSSCKDIREALREYVPIPDKAMKVRWSFLAKSHAQTADIQQQDFTCLFCVSLGNERRDRWHGVEQYMTHISDMHQRGIWSDVLLSAIRCINDRVAGPEEEFDINLYTQLALPRTVSPPVNSDKSSRIHLRDEFSTNDTIVHPTEASGLNTAVRQGDIAAEDLQLAEESGARGIDGISALLDPGTYFSGLHALSHRISKHFCPALETTEVLSWTAIDEALERVVAAISLMSDMGFCNHSVSCFIIDSERAGVLKTIDLSTNSIRELSTSVQDAVARRLTPEREKSMIRHATELLTGFDVAIRQNSFTDSEWSLPLRLRIQADSTLNYWTKNNPESRVPRAPFSFLCSLLATVILSYSASHCTSQVAEHGMKAIRRLNFGAADAHEDGLCSSHRRSPELMIKTGFGLHKISLACLNNFIQHEVYAFGSLEPDRPGPKSMKYHLSISARQFADLWGPVYAHQHPSHEGQLRAYGVDGGIIHTSIFTAKQAPFALKDEIPMQFTPTGPTAFAGRHVTRGPLEELTPFPATARLLIGRPPETVTCTLTKDTSTSTGTPQVSSSSKISPTSLLTVNLACKYENQSFAQAYSHQLHGLGTRESSYEPDAYQLSLGAGQYVNAGVQKVWKRRPGINYKDMIVAYCTKPHARLRAILALRIGLQMSICTGNARRATLWDTLLAAYPEDRDEQVLRRAYESEDGSIVAPYLEDLQWTGSLTQDRRMTLYWPYTTGAPQVLELDCGPQWAAMLKDTRDSAYFVTLIDQCLTYTLRDTAGCRHVTVRGGCKKGEWSSKTRPLLETKISLHPDSHVNLPLQPLARLKLVDGSTLEIRNQYRHAQLATYISDGMLNRFSELRIMTTDGNKGHIHKELLDGNASNTTSVRVGIIDAL